MPYDPETAAAALVALIQAYAYFDAEPAGKAEPEPVEYYEYVATG